MTANALTKRLSISLLALGLGFSAWGCKEDKEELAPKTQELEQAEAPETDTTAEFAVDTADTMVSFDMDAELEKINGKAPESAEGSIDVDLSDITKTTGLIKIDLMDLSIYQQKREDAEAEFGEPEKNETQNEHMRTWLQISEDAPEEQREKFRYIEFKITNVATDGKKNVLEMEGGERKLDVSVSGDLRLHGRTTQHTFPAEAAFMFDGDEVKGLKVTSKEPVGVSLEKHDVKPRKAFDVLADKTLSAMGAKVAKVAEVSLDLHADAKGPEAAPAE